MASESPNNTPRRAARRPQQKARDAETAGERRIVTALCYDLVGSTDLLHQLDMEDYRELIAAFQDAAKQAVASHSGVMRVEVGDGGLAIFPIELGARDAASLAIRAGLAIIEACKRVGRAVNRPDMRVRIGVATSIALIHETHDDDGTQEPVTGAALAMASRLEAIAVPDTVFVSDETRNLAGRSHAFTFEGARMLKGFTEPEKVWRAEEHKNEVDRFYAFGRLEGSFIGRTNELDIAAACWKKVRNGRGEILVIEGDAGIGKSRLLHEIRRLTRSTRSRSFVLQCSPGGSRSTLHPLLLSLSDDMAQSGSQLRPTTAALTTLFQRHGIADPQMIEIFAYLLGTLGKSELSSSSDPKAVRERARRTVLRALEAICMKGAVVLAIEDVHWIDPTSQDLLAEVARVIRQFPIFLLTTTRPGSAIDWLSDGAPTHLSLHPLDRSETIQAIEAKWPEQKRAALPELLEVAERISGGVPLFIEEICQWVSEIASPDKAKIPGTAAGNVARNHTLVFEEILDERLGRLGSARDVARAAAVAGDHATLQLLHILLPDFSLKDLADAAETLCESGFLTRAKTPSTEVYGFRHALIQETVYDALLRKQRQVLHRRLFAAVRENRDLAPWIDTGALAMHAERGGLGEDAVDLLITAGKESAARAAMIEARHHLESALALCEQISNASAVEAQQLSALTALGPILTGLVGLNSPPARKLYEDGVAIARRQPKQDQSKWFPIYWGWWLTGPDFLVMHDRALEVQTMLSGVDDPEIALQVKHCIWAIDFNLGWHKETQDAVNAGLALYDEQSARTARTLYGGHDAKVCGLGQLALSLWLSGQTEASDAALAEMTAYVDHIAHLPSTAHALDTEAVSAFYRDDYERLAEISRRMRDFSKKQEMQSLFGLSLLFEGWAAAHLESLAAGHEMFLEGLAMLQELGAVADLPIYLYMHATMLGLSGKHEKAIEVATDAIKEAKETGHAYWLAELYRCRGVLRAQGNARKELIAAELLTAMTIAESQGAMALLQRASRSTRELGVAIEK